jgi:CheY-like chemotaxis protein
MPANGACSLDNCFRRSSIRVMREVFLAGAPFLSKVAKVSRRPLIAAHRTLERRPAWWQLPWWYPACSVEGVGTTFTLSLPVTPTGGEPLVTLPLVNPVDDESPIAVRAALRVMVLLVDDRRDVRFVAQHVLEEAGATVGTAKDGVEALEAVESAAERGEPFDLILMDIQMPRMDGLTAVGRLREQGCRVPIIALTADAMREDRERCLNAGCDDYLTKPIDAAQLVEKSADLLRQSHEHLAELRRQRRTSASTR